MNSFSLFLKSFESSKLKIICRYKQIPRPTSFVVKKKPSKSDDSNDNQNRFFGYSLLAIPIFTFCLGTWQIQRRKWKLNLMEEVGSRYNLEPIDLPIDLNEMKSMEYVPVKVKGTYLHDKEFTFGPRSLVTDSMGLNEKNKTIISSTAGRGYHVITPFKLEDRDLTILVNRGWIPEQYRDPSKRSLGQIDGVQEIAGVIRLTEKKPAFVPANKPKENMWFYRNVEEIADLTGADPVFIDLAPADKKPETPISGQTRVSLRNEHLTYIITWYSLSIITGYLWYRQFIQKLPLL